LDKACIDQTNVDRDLACLPIFLAGCRGLVVLAGPTYFVRLWCIMEIFTFVYMGGNIERVTFVPLTATKAESTTSGDRTTSSAAHRHQREQLADGFRTFDASHAKCANPEDRDRLLGIVESACGSLDAFSSIVRETFAPQAEQMFTNKFANKFASERLSGSCRTPRESSLLSARRSRTSSISGVHIMLVEPSNRQDGNRAESAELAAKNADEEEGHTMDDALEQTKSGSAHDLEVHEVERV
jgi:hypothetical protein